MSIIICQSFLPYSVCENYLSPAAPIMCNSAPYLWEHRDNAGVECVAERLIEVAVGVSRPPTAEAQPEQQAHKLFTVRAGPTIEER